MNVYEMEGFMRGKVLPGDLLVDESNAAYLVRKLNEATAVKAERDALAVENNKLCKQLTHAEGCFKAAIFEGLDEALVESAGSNLADIVSRRIVHAFPSIGEPTPATDAAVAAIEARVWAEAKDFANSTLASDSADHIDFLFDGKIQQLREGK